MNLGGHYSTQYWCTQVHAWLCLLSEAKGWGQSRIAGDRKGEVGSATHWATESIPREYCLGGMQGLLISCIVCTHVSTGPCFPSEWGGHIWAGLTSRCDGICVRESPSKRRAGMERATRRLCSIWSPSLWAWEKRVVDRNQITFQMPYFYVYISWRSLES